MRVRGAETDVTRRDEVRYGSVSVGIAECSSYLLLATSSEITVSSFGASWRRDRLPERRARHRWDTPPCAFQPSQRAGSRPASGSTCAWSGGGGGGPSHRRPAFSSEVLALRRVVGASDACVRRSSSGLGMRGGRCAEALVESPHRRPGAPDPSACASSPICNGSVPPNARFDWMRRFRLRTPVRRDVSSY